MSYTYATLRADILNTLEDASLELEEALDSIIARAQEHIERRLDVVDLLSLVTVSVNANSRLVAMPARMRILKNITFVNLQTNERSFLEHKTNEYLTEFWPVYTATAVPQYFATRDNTNIVVAPTPAVAARVEIEYIPYYLPLSTSNTTNWISQRAGNALFFACLWQANLMRKNATAAQSWKLLLDDELLALANDARRQRRDDASDRSAGIPGNNLKEGMV